MTMQHHDMATDLGRAVSGAEARVAAIDWECAAADLDREGWIVLPGLLSDGECYATAALYGPSEAFRSRVIMARHGFGQGEYRYFAHPLPPLVQDLRTALYPRLSPTLRPPKKRSRSSRVAFTLSDPPADQDQHDAYCEEE